MEEVSFQLFLENCQEFGIPDRVVKIIPPAKNSELKHFGKSFCAFL